MSEIDELLASASSYRDFASVLRSMKPDEVGGAWSRGRDEGLVYWRQVNYQAATIDRLNQLGYLATGLDEGAREKCRGLAEAIAKHLRSWDVDPRVLKLLDTAIKSSMEYYNFGGSSDTTRAYMFENGMIDELGAKIEKPERAA